MEKTGKVIPINQTLVMLYMFSLLDQYDIAIELKKSVEVDPYRDNIIMKTDDGKYIEIPIEMQKYAIQKWIETKGKKNNKPSYENAYDQEYKKLHEQDDDTDDDKACHSCRKEKKQSDYTVIDTSFQLILCLIVIFALIYALSSIRYYVIKY